MIVYISIGNSDDRLSQAEWSAFCNAVSDAVEVNVLAIHGCWFSDPSSPWQNMCWCVELLDEHRTEILRTDLRQAARTYRQDSIAWAEVANTELLGSAT